MTTLGSAPQTRLVPRPLDGRRTKPLESARQTLSTPESPDATSTTQSRQKASYRPVVNMVILVGNLGRDPEVQALPNGYAVASFSVATSRRGKVEQGRRQYLTDWHHVVCYGRLAAIAGQCLGKGKQVFIEGRIQTRSWDDDAAGEKRYRTEVVCENFQLLGSRDDAGAIAEGDDVEV
jgi:single-strand DNA-binding protein